MKSFFFSLGKSASWRSLFFLIFLDLSFWAKKNKLEKTVFVAILSVLTCLGVVSHAGIALDQIEARVNSATEDALNRGFMGAARIAVTASGEREEEKNRDIKDFSLEMQEPRISPLAFFHGIVPDADAFAHAAPASKKTTFLIYAQSLTSDERAALASLGATIAPWSGDAPKAVESDDNQETIWVRPAKQKDASGRVVWIVWQSLTNKMLYFWSLGPSAHGQFLRVAALQNKTDLALHLREKGLDPSVLAPASYMDERAFSTGRGAPARVVSNFFLLACLFLLPALSAATSSFEWALWREVGSFSPWVSSSEPAWVIAGRWILFRAITQTLFSGAAAIVSLIFSLFFSREALGETLFLIFLVPIAVFFATLAWGAVALFQDNLFKHPLLRAFCAGLAPLADLILIRPFYVNARENLLHPPLFLFCSICFLFGLSFWALCAWRIGNKDRFCLRPSEPRSR